MSRILSLRFKVHPMPSQHITRTIHTVFKDPVIPTVLREVGNHVTPARAKQEGLRLVKDAIKEHYDECLPENSMKAKIMKHDRDIYVLVESRSQHSDKIASRLRGKHTDSILQRLTDLERERSDLRKRITKLETLVLRPIHARHVLDRARTELAGVLGFHSWNELHNNLLRKARQSVNKAVKILKQQLDRTQRQPQLSKATLIYLWKMNPERHAGNVAAHSALREDVRDLILHHMPDDTRKHFRQLYEFVHGVSVDTDTQTGYF